jgi:hypothetical protein
MPLHPRNATALSGASTAAVEQTLASTRRFLNDGSWLGKRNRYVTNTVNVIKDELKTNGVLTSPRNLAQYIAVSGVLHVADGWAYLGRAIIALLRGDPRRSLHLAYYAELRAAMSLLATEGIGVFSGDHFLVTGNCVVSRLPVKSPTHEFVWDVLQHWAGLAPTGSTLAEILHPYGRSLADWLQPVGGVAAFAPQARSWFEAWGMDLKELGNDREARNESSYRPGGLPTDWTLDATDAIAFVTDLWRMFEPSSTSFEQIDQHLMRTALETIFEARNNSRGAKKTADRRGFVNAIVTNQGLGPATEELWVSFLLRETDAADPGLILAAGVPTRRVPQDAFGVISRACLLLRAASGLADRSLGRAGIDAERIRFWKERLLAGRGLWQPGEMPSSADLWTDVRDATIDVDELVSSTNAQDRHLRHFAVELAQQLSVLGTCERIALWGIAST